MLNTQYVLNNEAKNLPYPQNRDAFFGSTWQKSWVIEIVDIVSLKFASNEAAEWKVDI